MIVVLFREEVDQCPVPFRFVTDIRAVRCAGYDVQLAAWQCGMGEFPGPIEWNSRISVTVQDQRRDGDIG